VNVFVIVNENHIGYKNKTLNS